MTEYINIGIYYLLIYLIGSSIGSFITVFVTRLYNNEKGIFLGRSKCPNCKKELSWYNLIPLVSYLVQKGRCQNCKKEIGKKYFFIEFFSLIGFGLLTYIFGISLDTLFENLFLLLYLSLFWFFLYSSILYDILYKEISDIISIGLILLVFLGLLGQNYFGLLDISLINSTIYTPNLDVFLYSLILVGLYITFFIESHLFLFIFISIYTFILGGTLGYNNYIGSGVLSSYIFYTFFYIQLLLTGGRGIGGGDLRYALILGLLYGLNSLFFGIFGTYLLACIFSLFLIVKHKTTKIEIAFVPYIIGSYLLILFLVKLNPNILNQLTNYIL